MGGVQSVADQFAWGVGATGEGGWVCDRHRFEGCLHKSFFSSTDTMFH